MRGLRGLMGLMGPMRPMRPMGLRGPMRPMGPMGLRGPIRLMGLIGLIGLLGCSGDSGEQGEEPEATGDAITFSGQQGDEEMVTRADTPLSESGVTSFTVWGYKNNGDAPYGRSQEVFPAYTVEWKKNSEATTTTNSSGWDYILPDKPLQTIKYWDWGASAYRFFAVTNWAGESDIHEDNKAYGKNGTYGDGDAYSMYKITMEIDVTSRRAIEDIPYFSTLWFSTGNLHDYPTREFGKPVQLVFTKPYSKVRFMYNYVYDRKKILLESQVFKPTADYSIVPPATPTGIARKGTFNIIYPLTGAETKEWYDIVPIAEGKLEAFTEDYDPYNASKEYLDAIDGWYSVFPNTTQGSYTLTVVINRLEKTCVVPAEYMQWKPGYSYTYIFKINEEGGVEIDQVQTAFSSWTEMYGDRTVYNW